MTVGIALILALSLCRLARTARLWDVAGSLALAGLVAGGLYLARPWLLGIGNANLVVFFVVLVGTCVLAGAAHPRGALCRGRHPRHGRRPVRAAVRRGVDPASLAARIVDRGYDRSSGTFRNTQTRLTVSSVAVTRNTQFSPAVAAISPPESGPSEPPRNIADAVIP